MGVKGVMGVIGVWDLFSKNGTPFWLAYKVYGVYGRRFGYSETKKYPHGRDFWMQNLTDFANLSKIYWVLEKNVLISIEALICGYFEPKKLRARPPNKASTPI